MGYYSFIQIICEKPPEVPFRPSHESKCGQHFENISRRIFEVLKVLDGGLVGHWIGSELCHS